MAKNLACYTLSPLLLYNLNREAKNGPISYRSCKTLSFIDRKLSTRQILIWYKTGGVINFH